MNDNNAKLEWNHQPIETANDGHHDLGGVLEVKKMPSTNEGLHTVMLAHREQFNDLECMHACASDTMNAGPNDTSNLHNDFQ